MPDIVQIPHIEPTDMDSVPLKTIQDRIDTKYALALVNETFYKYENFRAQNHDRRWNVHDQLYVGYVAPKTWDGTNIPRASVGVPIVFDQVETVAPLVSQALFNVGPEWFQINAEPGTDPKDAREVQDTLSYYLEHPVDDYCVSAKAEIRIAIKSTILYGNGGVSIEWDDNKKRPKIESVDIRDFYFDPGAPTPSTDASVSVIRRKFLTVDELLGMRDNPDMDVPSANILYTMAGSRATATADQTKTAQEAIRGVFFAPGTSDFAAFPADRKVEVLAYYSKSRIIWILNREWVMYNGTNPYGFVPFAFAPCYTYPSRTYAQSVADVQEGNQSIVQALINGHLDEIALALHPPRTMPRNSNLTPAQQKWRPGAMYAVDNPKDMQVFMPGSATANVFNDISYFEANAEKRTGINGLSGGVPRPSNANRTSSGMSMQLQGSGNRLSDLVSNIEDYLILPMLYKLYKIMQVHAQPGTKLQAYNQDRGLYEVDSSVVHTKIKFRMNASSRMITKDRLMQTFPILMQTVVQGPMLSQLNSMGQTVDFGQMFQMLQDATNVGRLYNLIRPLSQQEQQALQQPSPEMRADMQKSQMEQQTRLQMGKMKSDTELKTAQISKQPDAGAQLSAQIEMQKAQQEMQQEAEQNRQKMFMESMIQKIKIGAEQEKHRMDIEAKKADLQVKSVGHQQQMQQGQMSHQMKMQQMMDQLQMQKYAQDQNIGPENSKSRNIAPGAKTTSGDRPRKKAAISKKKPATSE